MTDNLVRGNQCSGLFAQLLPGITQNAHNFLTETDKPIRKTVQVTRHYAEHFSVMSFG